MTTLKENLKLPACGKDTIANASGLFYYIDSDFKSWGTDVASPKTKATEVKVLEIDKDSIFEQIFKSISADIESLVLTQAQIIEFVKKHKKWLRTDDYGTFFLFKVEDKFFVARVCVCFCGGERLEVDVYRFSRDYVWYAEGRHRIVVPQLATKPSEN